MCKWGTHTDVIVTVPADLSHTGKEIKTNNGERINSERSCVRCGKPPTPEGA